MATHPPLNDQALERLARRRAGMKLGWAVHATAYVLVNLLLAALSVQQGRHWAIYPALGWGLGLLLHGAAVWLNLPGNAIHERMLTRERRLLQRGQE
ncbi:MAG: 2TM domain-containing protein [Comamonas sp.]